MLRPKLQKLLPGKRPYSNGDTIVEVLIAIGIASFAIGISYDTAQRSLQAAISAKEHSEALSIMENQITALQARYNSYQQSDLTTTFQDDFGYGDTAHLHYCLDSNSTGPNDHSYQWSPYFNNNSVDQSSPLLTTADGPTGVYNPACTRPGDGFNYFIDITVSSANSGNKSLFQIYVRWPRVGGGQNNQTSLSYKVDG